MIKDIKETLWKINCDGYYPYCPKCKNEPPNGTLTYFCPNCGADLRRKELQTRTPLSKEEFCKIIDGLQKNEEFFYEINKIFLKFGKGDLIYPTDLEDIIIDLLENMFEDRESQWISYWVWEENYGKTYKEGDAVEKDGTIIPLGTAEELYDFLVKNMEDDANV